MIRQPFVAGSFYPSKPEVLKKMIAGFAPKPPQNNKEKAIACVLPPAGYVYSGKVAAAVLHAIEPPQTCVILSPNHTGNGPLASIMTQGEWATPLGPVSVNEDLAQDILRRSKFLEEDAIAHAEEHSIEVELPLIREILGEDVTFVPVTLASGEDLVYKDIALAAAQAIRSSGQKTLIIASSDMTHYEPHEQACRKDKEAIRAILELDEQELMRVIESHRISMCGSFPAAIAVLAAKLLGAKEGRLVAYQTSGEATQDFSSVVGYAGIILG